jgi:ubiquinone/menaquinone biosynthesis C-methylase UbiE
MNELMNEQKYWSQYWAQGNITSFTDIYANGYEGVIAKIWQNKFKTFSENQSVLDLCTGSASIIRLAKSKIPNFEMINFTGVDYAQELNVEDFSIYKNVELLPKINIEELPFENNCFDHVISNFGIEYSDIEKSIAEAIRVGKPTAKYHFLCHHHNSSILNDNSRLLICLNELNVEDGVLHTLSLLINLLDNKTNESEHIRNKLNQQLGLLAEKDIDSFHNSRVVEFIKYVLNPKIINKSLELNSFKSDLEAQSKRLVHLKNSALNLDKILLIKRLFDTNGISNVDVGTIEDKGNLVAFKIEVP